MRAKINPTVEIEKGVAIPERYGRRRWKKLLLTMKPGDSVLLEHSYELASIMAAARIMGMKYTSRKEDGGRRFWIL